ncbi:tRNA (adenosine(37)-N6)-dimethylallyltransferase MiaA [Candidatus Gottesmanbacteria bacterium RIFCSPHIGHO2_02_FULL_39_11]|uniref:tRNA dimethylallyltransferase n=1 Tax=Candidatus Gottesmanbacteria bacterium RIFCSPHIGHO2_02_FULL_39_11 TaxID=1798382 RepID=A0A1F5ZJY5_9BACT|nr:MAG: tRNA (adenosine(37)-N6)-dimethylallyltransferase MiaA [Candidatus Gottesmanbacteria bacterium RIFCSPHIGHO2_02_FULL_39_11]
MNNLLVILGPTAVGKTDLGITLAKKFNGEIVSADSRQVYKGMDIGTGKDISKLSNFQLSNSVGYRLKDRIPIWLIDVVSPDYQFNVGEYSVLAKKVIKDIQSRNKLPIVVGGTGLYIKSINEPPDTLHIPPDENLRKELENFNTRQLQEKLQRDSLKKWESMNNSDKNNPRRLVRAIEVELFNRHSNLQGKFQRASPDALIIGLTADKEVLKERIKTRIGKRLKDGVLEEIQALLNQGYSFDLPSFSACGYKVWKDYVKSSFGKPQDRQVKSNNENLYDKTIQRWILDETQYSKRQMTFFKRIKDINWFNINNLGYQYNIFNKVEEWYNK